MSEIRGNKEVGRPSSFKPEYCEQVEKLCRLGATDKDIANFFQVDESTINRWKEKPEFCESLKSGKAKSDAEVADRLYQRARGFEWEEIQAVKLKEVKYSNGKRVSEIERVELVPVQKVVPPDTTACIFWLKNRRSEDWRDKTEHKATVDHIHTIREEIVKPDVDPGWDSTHEDSPGIRTVN